jgi:hypothetical protein
MDSRTSHNSGLEKNIQESKKRAGRILKSALPARGRQPRRGTSKADKPFDDLDHDAGHDVRDRIMFFRHSPNLLSREKMTF